MVRKSLLRFDYWTIGIILKKLYGVVISLQTLKRHLVEYRLNKIGDDISNAGLWVTIKGEFSVPSSLAGYGHIQNNLCLAYRKFLEIK